MQNKLLENIFLQYAILMEKRIDELLPKDFYESRIVEAMRYSLLSSGKRIRPFLVISCAEIFGIKPQDALDTAIAVELVHTYSLIHDDLPSMDDDDFRRGNLSSHKKFDEATAILAGDALLTFAFEILASDKTHKNAAIRCDLIKVLATSSGFCGMVGGQMIDIENSKNKLTNEEIVNLHRKKTGELFMASCEMGAILGQASIQEKNYLRYYANDLGLAFQIKDDILDHQGLKLDEIKLDEIHRKKPKENTSIVDIIGLKQSQEKLEMLIEQSKIHLKHFGENAKILTLLADFVMNRKR